MHSEERRKLAETIRARVKEEIKQCVVPRIQDLDDLVREWKGCPATSEDVLLSDAFHAFLHFLSDTDIRLRDPVFAHTNREAMLELADKLESSN